MSAPLYLVRHGESEWNVRRLTQGQTMHPALTRRGREQAEGAAASLGDDLASTSRTVDVIVTSDLVRAVESAEIIRDRLGGTLRLDARLREQHLGDLEGRGYDETWAVAAQLDWSDPDLPVAGGESLRQVHDRMADVLAGADPTQVTVLVSHGDAMRMALAYLAGVAPHEAEWVEVPNGAVARIDRDLTGRSVVRWLARGSRPPHR